MLRGGANGFQLTDPRHVELRDLVLEGQTGNGLNVDDGGTPETPAHHVVLRGLAVRDVGPDGNRDGIKLSGILDFRVEDTTVERWWETLTPEDAASGLRWWAGVADCPSGTHAEIRAWAERTLPRTDAAQDPLTWPLTTLVRRLTLADARTALARVALAARERFDATGAWPASLCDVADAFPGGVPLDPVAGAPFTYEVGAATVRIASGATRTDFETDADLAAESWLRAEALLWEFPH